MTALPEGFIPHRTSGSLRHCWRTAVIAADPVETYEIQDHTRRAALASAGPLQSGKSHSETLETSESSAMFPHASRVTAA